MTAWSQQQVLVVGAGRSGAAAAQALLRREAHVTVLESGTAPAAVAGAEAVAALGARVVTDAAEVSPERFDLVVPSPGVPEHHPLLVAALAGGVPVWSEPELAWRLADGRMRLVAVTGTNGKTTTTELLAACLEAPTAGNIGIPLTSLVDADDAAALVVAELSSFQLRFTTTLRPDVAVLLNVAPDHLDWHGSLPAYRAAKARVWAHQRDGDVTVVSADDDGARLTVEEHPPPGRITRFTAAPPEPGDVGVAGGAIVVGSEDGPQAVAPLDELAMTGPHNVANACAAVAAALAAGATASELHAPLSGYRPGRHRLEHVARVEGVDYVDDSKATNPHAAAASLASYPPGTVVWIAGGLGKGLDFASLEPLIRRHVRAALTIGADGPALAAVARNAGVDVIEATTLQAAVPAAARLAKPGDTVLLAPACASMDQFTDYAHRGEVFRHAVTSLAGDVPPQGAASGR